MKLMQHLRTGGPNRRTTVHPSMPKCGMAGARVETVEPRLMLAAAPLDKADPLGKLGGTLSGLYAEFTDFRDANPGRVDAFKPADDLVRTRGGQVAIEAVATGDVGGLLNELKALGMRDAQVAGSMVGGLLPIAALDELADEAGLAFARPAIYVTHAERAAAAADGAVTHVGATTSQADDAMRADVARSTYGVNGSGSVVGIISDSFDTGPGSYAADQNTDDLPAGVNILADQASGSDEGRAMAQLIHDVAPGAGLAFHTAGLSQPAFANGITALRNAGGADVIVDDVLFLAEPMFQDGVIAQSVDAAVAAGVPYFSAAGNMGRNAYESAFRAGTTFGGNAFPVANDGQAPAAFYGGVAHDFNPTTTTDVMQQFTLGAGQAILLSFQWDSPYASAGPAGSPGSPNDMDVYVLNAAGNTVVGGETTENTGGDPVEVFQFVNTTGAAATFNLMLVNYSGPNPGYLKYVNFKTHNPTEYDTNSGTVYGHSNAAGASAVAAAFYEDTPEFGVNPPRVEDFSSRGQTPIFFAKNGTRLSSAAARNKPRITAPDGTNTTFFGNDIPDDTDSYPNFFGTSAAAPHAAAVAALMQDAAGFVSPSTIYQALESTALDMDDPDVSNFQTGYDSATGFGLIRADLAVGAVAPKATTTTLRAVADAYVRDGSSYTNKNYGTATQLQVKQGSTGYTRHTYLRFDMSSAASVGSAKLRLFGKLDNTAASSVGFRVFNASNTSWGETSITFSNKPAAGTTVRGSGTVTGRTGKAYEVDLTSFLKAEFDAGRKLVTLVIKAASSSQSTILFDSDESATAANRPQLVITPAGATPQALVVSASNLSVPEGGSAAFTVKLAAQPTSDVTVNLAKASGGDGDLTTAAGSMTFTSANWNAAQSVSVAAAEDTDTTNGTASFTVSSAGLASKTVVATEVDNDTPPAPTLLHAGADTYVRDGSTYADTNFGLDSQLQVKQGSVGWNRESYLRFDLSSVSTVNGAKLRLFGKLDNTKAASAGFTLFNSANLDWPETGITYNTKMTAGTTVRGAGTVTGTSGKWYEIDLTGFLQDEKAANRDLVTLVIRADAASPSTIVFDSDAATNRPQLLVS